MSQLSLGETPDLTSTDVALEGGFRGPEVCSVIGISYRQLDYWTRTGLVRASVAEAKGSGTQRLYSYRDLVEVKVIKSLLDGGISLRRARKAVEYLRDHLGEDLASANLVIDGSDSLLVHTDGEIVDLLRRGQGVLNVVPLAGVTQELNARIHELRPGATGTDTDTGGRHGAGDLTYRPESASGG